MPAPALIVWRPDRPGVKPAQPQREKTQSLSSNHSRDLARWAPATARKAQAETGDIVLLYGDEGEVVTRAGAHGPNTGADLRAPGQIKKVAMMGSIASHAGSLAPYSQSLLRCIHCRFHASVLGLAGGRRLKLLEKERCRAAVQAPPAEFAARPVLRPGRGSLLR